MYIVPSLKDLMQKARFGFRKHLKGTDAWLWPNNVYVVAKVLAGLTMEIMGWASYIARRQFAHTAPDLDALTLHGEEFGIPRKPAAPAYGKIVVEVTQPVSVAVGATLRRLDNVVLNVIDGGSTTTPGQLVLNVTALEPGAMGNTLAGVGLEPISGFTGGGDITAYVGTDGVSLGVDVEDIESWRSRILFRKRNPPHGGSAADYVLWAGEVPGVSFYDDRPTVYVERTWAGPERFASSR